MTRLLAYLIAGIVALDAVIPESVLIYLASKGWFHGRKETPRK
jgi:hypothetical protein